MTNKRRIRGQPKLIKKNCEICGTKEKKVLDIHHIIPRCDERCKNDNSNLAVICSNCHRLTHSGEIIILGVYFGTNGRKIVWHKKDEAPPFEEEFWKIKNNDKVIMK